MLFNQGDLRAELQRLEEKVQEEVNNIQMDRFQNETTEELIKDLCSCLRVNPIVLSEPNKPLKSLHDQCNPPTIEIIIDIPFEGEGWIFCYMTYPRSIQHHPNADVQTDILKLTYNIPNNGNIELFRNKFSQDLDQIKEHVIRANEEIRQHNQRICNSVRTEVNRRRDELNQLQSLSDEIDDAFLNS